MTKPLNDIVEIPINACPICGSTLLSIKTGKKKFIGKHPDRVKCGSGPEFLVSKDRTLIKYERLSSPYLFFSEFFDEWVNPSEAAKLFSYINDNSPEALSFLPEAKRLAWNVRLILGCQGRADSDGVIYTYTPDEYETKGEANKEIVEIRQLQKEARQVKREMTQDMKEIRASYGRKKANQLAIEAHLAPYEVICLSIDELLVKLDRMKLDIQNWIDEQ